MTYLEALREFKIDYVKSVLIQCHGNVTAAAKIAGMPRSCLHKLIKKYAIQFERASHIQRGSRRGNWALHGL